MPDILGALDVFALTSVSEAASLTLLEAMASGVPVVVTAVGGNPELVRHGIDGLHVPRGDANATSAALLRILDDPALASHMGHAGRQRVVERLSTRMRPSRLTSNCIGICAHHIRLEMAATIAIISTIRPVRATRSLNRRIATVFLRNKRTPGEPKS